MRVVPQATCFSLAVDPLEVMFIKVKGSMRAAAWPHVATAAKFDQWLSATHQRNPALRNAGVWCANRKCQAW